MDQHDPLALGLLDAIDPNRLAINQDVALVGGQHAAENLHERRLAGAVLADDGQDLAALQMQAYAVQGLDAWKRLRYPLRLEHGLLIRAFLDLQVAMELFDVLIKELA